MDALMDARTHTESALKTGWQEIQTLAKGYSAMGGDPTTIVPALTGTARPVTVRTTSRSSGGGSARARGSTRATARSGTRRRSGGGNGATAGPQITEQQFVGFLAEHGGQTVAQIASHFGVSEQTIRRYGKRWASAIDTSSPTWTAAGAAAGV